jgi:hypothetical protein
MAVVAGKNVLLLERSAGRAASGRVPIAYIIIDAVAGSLRPVSADSAVHKPRTINATGLFISILQPVHF